jgi:hypothetical protein
VTFLVGSSSGSSSMRGFDILGGYVWSGSVSKLTLSSRDFVNFLVCASAERTLAKRGARQKLRGEE